MNRLCQKDLKHLSFPGPASSVTQSSCMAAPANLTTFLHLRRLRKIRWEIEMLTPNSRWQCLLSNSQSFFNTIHPCSPNFNEILKGIYSLPENKISGYTWHFTPSRILKIAKYITHQLLYELSGETWQILSYNQYDFFEIIANHRFFFLFF